MLQQVLLVLLVLLLAQLQAPPQQLRLLQQHAVMANTTTSKPKCAYALKLSLLKMIKGYALTVFYPNISIRLLKNVENVLPAQSIVSMTRDVWNVLLLSLLLLGLTVLHALVIWHSTVYPRDASALNKDHTMMAKFAHNAFSLNSGTLKL